jgi:hypothetical protein
MTMKSISIKGQGCKSGRCAVKAVVLTPEGLGCVPDLGLRGSRGPLTATQESAEAIVGVKPEAPRVGGVGNEASLTSHVYERPASVWLPIFFGSRLIA